MKPERRLQLDVCQWIRYQYPDLIFWSNDSGEKKPVGLAILSKRMRSGSKIPDIWISEPRGGFHGLYIELKVSSPYKKDGTLKSNPHTEAQAAMLDKLNERGYMASFGVGFDATINIIKMYMSQAIKKQVCPKCSGFGVVSSPYQTTTSFSITCPICKGTKTI